MNIFKNSDEVFYNLKRTIFACQVNPHRIRLSSSNSSWFWVLHLCLHAS
ncbi:hypothetical protein BSPLISOX_2552 [uncultured Gammaproteobacteria bacterium]|nr:hypothetical protein BSPLISOX_2552 [uncultured Gammaproteobacteria bacterium]